MALTFSVLVSCLRLFLSCFSFLSLSFSLLLLYLFLFLSCFSGLSLSLSLFASVDFLSLSFSLLLLCTVDIYLKLASLVFQGWQQQSEVPLKWRRRRGLSHAAAQRPRGWRPLPSTRGQQWPPLGRGQSQLIPALCRRPRVHPDHPHTEAARYTECKSIVRRYMWSHFDPVPAPASQDGGSSSSSSTV